MQTTPPHSTVVVTPTIGSPHLPRALQSVQEQTQRNLEHLVISDGPMAARAAAAALEGFRGGPVPVHHVALPYNTGSAGMNGYRILAAAAHLINADVVVFLDDDNWYTPTHVEECVATLREFGSDWAFALRTVTREDGTELIADDCDSLGPWRRAASYRGDAEWLAPPFQRFYATHPFLVDTNCYALRRETFVKHANAMLHRFWGDSMLADALINHARGAATGARTVFYRVRCRNEAQALDYFMKGNEEHHARFRGERPWTRRQAFTPLHEVEIPVF